MSRPEGARFVRQCGASRRRDARRHGRARRAGAVPLPGADRDRRAGTVREDGLAGRRLRPRRAGRPARPAHRRRQAASVCPSPSCRRWRRCRLSEQVREASLYPLPARPTAGGVWASPVDVVVEGDRISVRRRGGVGQHRRGRAARIGRLADRQRRDPARRSVAQEPDLALVGSGRVLGRLPDRDQRRPAPMAARRQWPGDGIAIGERHAGAARRRPARVARPLRSPGLGRAAARRRR